MQIEFYNRGCKAFFKKHGQRKMIEKTIAAAIAKEVATGMTKVKLASHQRIIGYWRSGSGLFHHYSPAEGDL